MNKVAPLRMAHFFNSSAKSLDPAKIVLSYEYILLQNLFGTLIEYDPMGKLVVGIPESFSTTEDSIQFTFGQRAKTVSGKAISAEDAGLSLKRNIALGKSGHGDIRRFLCPGYKLVNPQGDCPGILPI